VSFDDATRRMFEVNQANWDARTPVHAGSAFYGAAGGRDPFSWFAPFEWEDLGDLRCRDLIHLQCHIGTETIAFARKQARTVGLDFSGESLAHARRLAGNAQVSVEYVQSNVYDSVTALAGRRFDVVYTGKGALCYLPDLARWASVVTELLRPGGLLYLVEFHPVLYALGPKPAPDAGPELVLRHDYLAGRGAVEHTVTHTYTDGPALASGTVAYEWAHGLGEVVNALLGAGLRIARLRETELLPWRRWQRMVPVADGWWRLPDEDARIPLLYALAATRP
jgi:SAM-dependent methyltransferase